MPEKGIEDPLLEIREPYSTYYPHRKKRTPGVSVLRQIPPLIGNKIITLNHIPETQCVIVELEVYTDP